MTVWVTGAGGMLGQELVRRLGEAGYLVLATDREVDITRVEQVEGFLSAHPGIDYIANCAAWTAVDAAEDNAEAARLLNAEGPGVLAAAAHAAGAAMLHISTDYVFSGNAGMPYVPQDETAPQSVYGQTKLAGEHAVRSAVARHVIVRTAWLFGSAGKNFVGTMLRLFAEKTEIGVVADQYGLPTYAGDLAQALCDVIAGSSAVDASPVWGTYHYTNSGVNTEQEQSGITWHEFAGEIHKAARSLELISADCRINRLTTAEYPTAAVRPQYSVLDSTSLTQAFGVSRPTWKDALTRCLQVIKQKTFKEHA